MAAEHRIVKAGVIKVGNRVRKDMGDMTALTESIRTIGLLHPPIVDAEYNLIAGRRRLAAYVNELGNIDVPVLVVRELSDAAMALQAERDENTCRKDMTPTELVEIGRRIEELERPKAKERQGRRTDLQLPENFTGSEKGRSYTRDIVGEAIGMSGPTYQRAKAVVEAAEREPAKFADVAEQMDKTGKVTPAYQEMKRRSEGQAEQADASPPVESKPASHPKSKAVQLAHEAINLLKRIPVNDPMRADGLGIVAKWIRDNR